MKIYIVTVDGKFRRPYKTLKTLAEKETTGVSLHRLYRVKFPYTTKTGLTIERHEV